MGVNLDASNYLPVHFVTMRSSIVLITTAIALLTLAGCNSAQQLTTPTSPAASNTSPTGTTQQTATQDGYQSLLGVVSNTRAAVEAGNFIKAKEEFNKFENNWKQVEDGIKAKSANNYKAIEDSLDGVMGELRGAGPNKERVLALLQSLEQNINSVAKL